MNWQKIAEGTWPVAVSNQPEARVGMRLPSNDHTFKVTIPISASMFNHSKTAPAQSLCLSASQTHVLSHFLRPWVSYTRPSVMFITVLRADRSMASKEEIAAPDSPAEIRHCASMNLTSATVRYSFWVRRV